MSNFVRRTILVCGLIILLYNTCLAQSNYTDSLTITTYYPAPYGVYKNMQLSPSKEPAGAAVNRGTMYFNDTENRMYYYNGSEWIPYNFVKNLFLQPTTRFYQEQKPPRRGQIYFDTDDNATYVWNGTAWDYITPEIPQSGDLPEPPSDKIVMSTSCKVSADIGCLAYGDPGCARWSDGVVMSAFPGPCTDWCKGKGLNYHSVVCSNPVGAASRIGLGNRWDFHTCMHYSGINDFHWATFFQEGTVYCHKNANVTCNCK